MKGFFLGLRSYMLVYGFIKQNKIWVFYYLPLLLNTLLYVVYFKLLSYLMSSIEELMNNFFHVNNLTHSIFSAVLDIVLFLIKQLTILFTFQYVSLIILAPLYSILSETVLNKINKSPKAFTAKQILKDIVRGLGVGLCSLTMQAFLGLSIFVFSMLITPLAPIGALLLFISGTYFYGAAMLDYRNEYYCLSIKDSIRFSFANFGFCIGIGIVFQCFFMLPYLGVVVGVLLGPSFSIVAAILGMENMLKRDETYGTI